MSPKRISDVSSLNLKELNFVMKINSIWAIRTIGVIGMIYKIILMFLKRQSSGSSLMVWADFGCNENTTLTFPKSQMSGVAYRNLLEENLWLFGENL